jgi:hypothetical protein
MATERREACMWGWCEFYVRSKLCRFSAGSKSLHLRFTYVLDRRKAEIVQTLNCINGTASMDFYTLVNASSG